MDATVLYTYSDRLDTHEAVLRSRARTLDAHAESLHWHSPAARRFRTRLHEVAVELVRAAAATAELSARLRAHAARVERHP